MAARMSITKKFLWTLISIPLTLVAAVVAIISMGGGHGNSLAATYLFPYAMLTGLSTQMVNNTFVVIGLIQFPVYGLIADFTKGDNSSTHNRSFSRHTLMDGCLCYHEQRLIYF